MLSANVSDKPNLLNAKGTSETFKYNIMHQGYPTRVSIA